MIIINVNTRLPTTLALLSAIKTAGLPVILIDCSTGDGDMEYFQKLREQFSFHLFHLPLNVHGITLDLVFRNVRADKILLLDSDAEITDFSFFRNDIINDDDVFGVGFVHGPCPMSEHTMKAYRFYYYQERMYIPCVLLKRNKIIEALDAGCSFAEKYDYNDFPIPFVARQLARRFRFPFFHVHDFPLLKFFRRIYYDYFKPSAVCYDTGSKVYCYLKYKCCQHFIGLPVKYHKNYFTHYGGLTIGVLHPDEYNQADIASFGDFARGRLLAAYDFDVSTIEKSR